MTNDSHPVDSENLRYYLRVARRRLGVIVVLAIGLPAVSLLVALRQTPVYEASSEVLVRRENLAASLTNTHTPYTDGPTAERLIETQVELARMPSLVTRVLSGSGVGPERREDFLGSSWVEAKPNTDILVLTVESSTPALAIRLAAMYAREFSEYRRELDRAELDSVAGEVRRQLASLDTPEGRATPLGVDLQLRLRQIETLQALQSRSAVVVREADTAEQTKPRPASMVAGGLVLGVILGVGVAFLIETLDDRVRTSREVVDRLRLPLLGRLPPPSEESSDEMQLVTLATPGSQAMEPFNFLRTRLNFANRDPLAQVIMVTSAGEQEGRSSTVANLAVALARAGSRVALVDLDLRRPTIHRLFRIPQGPGAVDVAISSADLDDAVIEVGVGSPDGSDGLGRSGPGGSRSSCLQVLPAGRATPGVSASRLGAVLDGLRPRADVVLVDAPPMLHAGEAVALSVEMDALVVVARLNVARGPVLDELRRALDAAPVRGLGVVCTGEEDGERHADDHGHRFRRASPSYPRALRRPPGPLASNERVLTGAHVREPSRAPHDAARPEA